MKKTFVVIALFTAVTAVAGPLGLSKGMTLDEVKKQGNFIPVPNQTSIYKSSTLTNGHPDFESYLVILTPQHGLCKIIATGKDISTSVYGDELKQKFESLNDALSGKYGKPKNPYDFLNSGSIWNEPKDWMMSLLQKERTLKNFWPKGTSFPDSIDNIALQATAASTSKGWIRLIYEFDNSEVCIDSLDAKKNSNL